MKRRQFAARPAGCCWQRHSHAHGLPAVTWWQSVHQTWPVRRSESPCWSCAVRRAQACKDNAQLESGDPDAPACWRRASSISMTWFSASPSRAWSSSVTAGATRLSPWFDARGADERTRLEEPIPWRARAGRQSLAVKTVPSSACWTPWRLSAALQGRAQAPHFAYGPLTRAQYERAHLMHLANHWQQLKRRPERGRPHEIQPATMARMQGEFEMSIKFASGQRRGHHSRSPAPRRKERADPRDVRSRWPMHWSP